MPDHAYSALFNRPLWLKTHHAFCLALSRTFETEVEAVEEANRCDRGLAAYLYTSDYSQVKARRLAVGVVQNYLLLALGFSDEDDNCDANFMLIVILHRPGGYPVSLSQVWLLIFHTTEHPPSPLLEQLKTFSGMVGVNDVAISTPECPFGGYKTSGIGTGKG